MLLYSALEKCYRGSGDLDVGGGHAQECLVARH